MTELLLAVNLSRSVAVAAGCWSRVSGAAVSGPISPPGRRPLRHARQAGRLRGGVADRLRPVSDGAARLRARSARWRLSPRQYAIAPFAAPSLILVTRLPLSLLSESFAPALNAKSGALGILALGLGSGLSAQAWRSRVRASAPSEAIPSRSRFRPRCLSAVSCSRRCRGSVPSPDCERVAQQADRAGTRRAACRSSVARRG